MGISIFHRMAFSVLVSTDKSLAKEIRDKLFDEVATAVGADVLRGEYFDTNEEGKGWKPGSVSFAVKPSDWYGRFNGGILVQCTFDRKQLKSEAPEAGTPEYDAWLKAGGNPALKGSPAIDGQLQGGYYNKSPSGGVDEWTDLGEVLFTVDQAEDITDIDLVDPGATKAGFEEIVRRIETDPPEGALTSKQKSRTNQYKNVKRFRDWLVTQGRDWYSQAELERLHKETGTPYPALKTELERRNARLR
jgi:hypothetical protein